jgi:CrcB protein
VGDRPDFPDLTGRPAAAGPRPRRRRSIDVSLVIAVGGALGALARHGLTLWMPADAGAFPWATFWTNLSGCLLIGVLMVLITEVAGRPHRLLRPFVGVGLLGGFTTFSTYAVQTQQLFAQEAPGTALVYLFGTLVAALLAVETGMMLTRWAARGHRHRKGPGA